jgi:hypothetical protein
MASGVLQSQEDVIVIRSSSPSLEADKGKVDLIAEKCQEKLDDILKDDDAAPTQDTLEHAKEQRDSSPVEVDELEASYEEKDPTEEEVPVAVLAQTQELVVGQGQYHSVDDNIPSHPDSFSIVDTLLDEAEVEQDVLVDLTRTTTSIDHPETTLSHSKDGDYPTSSTSFVQSTVLARRGRDDGVTGRSLFLGSDDEDDSSSHADKQRSTRQGPSEKSKKSSLDQARCRPITAAEKGKQSISAADKAKQTEVVPAHSTRLSKGGVSVKKHRDNGKGAAAENGIPLAETSKRKSRSPIETSRQSKKAKEERKKQAEKDDLTQNLNVDAYAHSTSNRRSNAMRAKGLKRLQYLKQRKERKQQGEDLSTTASSSDDSSDDSDSDSDDKSDFIVEDDDDEPRSSKAEHKGAKRIPMPEQALPPPSLVSRDLLSDVRAMTRPQKMQEYIRWVIRYALDMELTPDMIAVRTNLREKFKGDYSSLTTQGNRRQFTWYLRHYPFFERRPMTREEKSKHRGCAACGRTKQKCKDVFIVWGEIYKLDTLEQRSDYTSSDMSSEAEDCKTKTSDKKFLFYLGSSCAKFASVKHRLLHWERRVLNDVVKLPLFKTLKSRYTRKAHRANTEEDIEAIVAFYYPTLSKRGTRLEMDARTLLTEQSRYTRLRDKWDDDP